MELNTQYTDPVRRFWIDDNQPQWEILEGELSYYVRNNCKLLGHDIIDVDVSNDKVAFSKAIYLGNFINIWGHCITDNLKRLCFLKTSIGKDMLSQGYKMVCTLLKNNKFNDNFVKLLRYLDIDADAITIVQDGTCFETLIIPDKSLSEGHHYYKEYKELIDKIRAQIPYKIDSPKKVYFSRARLNNGRDFGEKNVENVFRMLGYDIFYPEDVPLEEQLTILKSCDSFAATEGSISHNVMFCRDGVECVIIRKTVSLNGYQFSANRMRDVNATFIDAHLSLFRIFDDSYGPFFLYRNQNLVNYANDKGLKLRVSFPRWTFIRYCMQTVWLMLRFRIKPKLIKRDPDFYWKRLRSDFFAQ